MEPSCDDVTVVSLRSPWISSSWWFFTNPLEKYAKVKFGSFPPGIGVKIPKKSLSCHHQSFWIPGPPPRMQNRQKLPMIASWEGAETTQWPDQLDFQMQLGTQHRYCYWQTWPTFTHQEKIRTDSFSMMEKLRSGKSSWKNHQPDHGPNTTQICKYAAQGLVDGGPWGIPPMFQRHHGES